MKYLLFIGIILLSCTSAKRAFLPADAPSWIKKPQNVFQDALCASGDFSTQDLADAKAKENLLKDISSPESNLSLYIKERYTFGTDHYALACAKKDAVLSTLNSAINAVDKELATISSQKSLWRKEEAIELLEKRSSYTQSLSNIDKKTPPPAAITIDEINSWKPQTEKAVFIAENESTPTELTQFLKGIIIKAGYTVTADETSAQALITATHSMTERYLKVPGFKEYGVDMDITHTRPNKQSIGSFTLHYTAKTREGESPLDKMDQALKVDIMKHMHLLNLDK